MEQLNSVFNFIRRGSGVKEGSRSFAEKPKWCSNLNSSKTEDINFVDILEEDGFLLVNKTECNNTSVPPSIAGDLTVETQCAFQSYGQVYREGGVCTGRGFTESAYSMPSVLHPRDLRKTHDESQSISLHPAIVDIPFQLDPKLHKKCQLQNMLHHLDLETTPFDWEKYYYDFDCENTFLYDIQESEEGNKHRDCTMSRSFLWER